MAGFIVAAAVVGFLSENGNRIVRAGSFFAGSAVILTSGALWLFVSTPMGLIESLIVGILPFIPGDCVKSLAAFLISERLNDSS